MISKKIDQNLFLKISNWVRMIYTTKGRYCV